MDTFKLKAILRAVETGSMAKAAREFSYTPSALSHSIDSLEKELGLRLLDRSPNGVKLTADGEKIKNKIQAVIDAENEVFDFARALSKNESKTLRIGAYASISSTFLPEILNGFRDTYPEISISITLGNYVSDWLKNDLSDVILASRIPDAEWLPVMEDEFAAVVPKNMFCDKQSISIEELYPYTYIKNESKLGNTYLEDSKFKEVLPFEAEEYTAVLPLVKNGMGISFLPQLVLDKTLQGINILKINPPIYRTLGASYKKGLSKQSPAMLFINYLKGKVQGEII